MTVACTWFLVACIHVRDTLHQDGHALHFNLTLYI